MKIIRTEARGPAKNGEDCGPVSQEIWTLGNLDAASIFPRKFDRLNFLKRQLFPQDIRSP